MRDLIIEARRGMGKEPVVSIMAALVLGLTDDTVDDRLESKIEASRLSEIYNSVSIWMCDTKEGDRNQVT
jgi:hypothetical protein